MSTETTPETERLIAYLTDALTTLPWNTLTHAALRRFTYIAFRDGQFDALATGESPDMLRHILHSAKQALAVASTAHDRGRIRNAIMRLENRLDLLTEKLSEQEAD